MRWQVFLGAALLAATTSAVLAQSDRREATMKEVGRNFGTLNRMNRGQVPYDGTAASQAFGRIAESAAEFGTLFEGAPSPGGDALPSIWENKADFDARIGKLSTDAKSAATEASKDEASFKSAFADLQPQCGGCHQKYRKKDD